MFHKNFEKYQNIASETVKAGAPVLWKKISLLLKKYKRYYIISICFNNKIRINVKNI